MSLEQARAFVEDCKIALMMKQPFYYFMLNSMEIVYKEENSPKGTGGIAMNGHTLILHKNFFGSQEQKKYPIQVTKHEILHLVLEHTVRINELVRKLYHDGALNSIDDLAMMSNLAMDAKVNDLLNKEGERTDFGFNGRQWWSQKEIEENNIEELVLSRCKEMLESRFKGIMRDVLAELDKDGERIQSGGKGEGKDGQQKLSGGQDGEAEKDEDKGKQIQVGDTRFGKLSKEEQREAVKKIVLENICKAKVAGVGSGGILREIEESLLKPKKQAWYERFRQCLKSVLIKSKISDWRIQNRKLPGIIAGMRVVKKPRMWCGIDVSGSIGTEEYTMFIREVLNFIREGEVTATFWDDGIIESKKVKNKEQLIRGVHGGGGTRLAPVIKNTNFSNYDVMVVLTDGYLYDDDEVAKALKKVRCLRVLLTTGKMLEGFDTKILIDRGN